MRLSTRTKKRLALLLAVAVIGGAGLVVLRIVRDLRLERSLEAALKEGSAAYAAGDHQAAMRHLSFYVARRKEHDAILMLADCRRHVPEENRRHILMAIQFARAAADLEPTSIPAHELLLDLQMEAGFATEMASTADTLLALQPGHRRATDARIAAMARLGKFEDALSAAKVVAERHPGDVQARRNVAQFMQLANRPLSEIREYLERDATRAGEDFGFALLSTEAAMLTGDAAQALERAQRAAALPIESGRDLVQFLRLLDALAPSQPQANELVDQVLEREFAGDLRAEVALIAAERAWKAGRLDLATQYVQGLIDAAPSLVDVHSAALGWWVLFQPPAAQGSQNPDVERTLAELRRRTSTESSFWLSVIQGNTALQESDLRLASQHFEQAAAMNYPSPIPELMLGHVDRRLGEWRRAATRWESLLTRNPNWRSLRASLVSLLIDAGQYDEAVDRARTALAFARGRGEALQFCRAVMALVESRRGDVSRRSEMLDLMESIADQLPEDGAVQTCAARAYLAAGRLSAATRAAERALAADPPPPADLLMPLATQFREYDQDLAGRLQEVALGSASERDAVYVKALSLAQEGQVAEARAMLERQAENAQPAERLNLQLRIARLLVDVGDPSATEYLGKIAADHHRSPEAQLALLENQGAWENEQIVSAAIKRLREAGGSESTAWRTFEARRLLSFSSSQARAAEAVQVLSPVLRQRSGNALALALAGEAYLVLDHRDMAIEQVARAVDQEPARPTFYPRLIELLQMAGRSEEASRRLDEFARLDRLPPGLRRARAQLALAQGNWQLAESDYNALASEDLLDDRFGIALAQLRSGQPERARSTLEDIAKSPQATSNMLAVAADMRANAGDLDGGRRLIETAPADLTPATRHTLVGLYLQRHGRHSEAEAILIAAADAGQAPDVIAELVRYYLDSGRLEEARAALARGMASHPRDPSLQRVAALVRIHEGKDLAAAWADLAEAMKSWPDAPPPLRDLASIMQRRANNPRAVAEHITQLEQFTRRYPTFFSGWELLVRELVEAGDLNRAASTAQASITSIPTDPRPAMMATQVLGQIGRLDDALAAATQWRLRSSPDTFDADMVAAWLQQQTSRPSEAMRLLEPWRSRIVREENLEHITLLAGCLLDSLRISEAEQVIGPLAQRDRSWAVQYALLTTRIEDPAAARDWLARAAPLLATDASGHFALGDAYLNLLRRTRSRDDLQRAESSLREAMRDESLRFGALVLVAGGYDTAGDSAEAGRLYNEALAIRPDDPVVLNNLAYILAQDPVTVEQASSMASRALGLARERGLPGPVIRAILDTHGLALLGCRKWPEAERAFTEALELDPGSPELLVGLAGAVLGLGKPEDAARHIATAKSRIRPSEPLSATRAALLQDLERRLAR